MSHELSKKELVPIVLVREEKVFRPSCWQIFQHAAFFWKPAPGNKLGAHFKMGNMSTKMAPVMPKTSQAAAIEM